MKKELFVHQGLKFEIKTVSEANSFKDRHLIVAIKYNEELLEFYHAHSETVADFKTQNKTELEDRLFEIAKSEIESRFFERVHTK